MGLVNLFTKRQRIAKLAREKRGVALSTLHHVIGLDWMKEAYGLTRKDGAAAPGAAGRGCSHSRGKVMRWLNAVAWIAAAVGLAFGLYVLFFFIERNSQGELINDAGDLDEGYALLIFFSAFLAGGIAIGAMLGVISGLISGAFVLLRRLISRRA